ncbi:protein glycoside hydrolase, family 19 domain-containing protein, partial [Thalassiosira pseudonana CCMP1335]
MRKELAAFLGNTAHESDDFEAGREYLACGDRKCSVSMVDQNSPYNSYCQPSFEPPEGSSKVFYGRGAIQLSWNYNYIRASYALTGKAETFCDDPEQVAENPLYAWGTGMYFWMESEKEGTTCHKEALKGDFGGTLNTINGGLEC